MRALLIVFVLLITGFLVLQSRVSQNTEEKPIFLKEDVISKQHRTKINIIVESNIKPTDFQLQILKQDYANIWAHLNHLYHTNEVEIGKEYYTEDWFKQICAHYQKPIENPIRRTDISHQLHLKTWASDALVCTAIDSNVVLTYQYPNQKSIQKKANIAVVLQFQGDNWRIDALKILNESLIK